MDGKHFKVKDMQEGVTAPPFHPNCRCTTVPYYPDDYGVLGTRTARDEEGKNVEVDSKLKYPEWKEKYVINNSGDNKEPEKEHLTEEELKEKIKEANVQIEDLSSQFSDVMKDEGDLSWKEFKTDYGHDYSQITDNDTELSKLKAIGDKIDDIEAQKAEWQSMLDEKTKNTQNEVAKNNKSGIIRAKRGQLDTGYPGKIPASELDKYNEKGLEQIKIDTGYSDEKAKEFQDALLKYFGGDYETIISSPELKETRDILEGLAYMPKYEGSPIYRGLLLDKKEAVKLSELGNGDSFPSIGVLESWSSNERTAISFAGIQSYEKSSIILECEDNIKGVGLQHLSKFGSAEAEVLVPNPNYEVVSVEIESKYDFLAKRQELLVFGDDLEEYEKELKGEIVCRIKLKEIN